MPPLLLDVHLPPDVPPAPVAALLRSCSEAASVVCEEREAGALALPDAVVLWGDTEFSSARIWVGTVDSDRSYQQLHFSTRDRIDDRFASVGLIVAALYHRRLLEGAPREKTAIPPAKSQTLPIEKPTEAPEQQDLELRLLGTLSGGFGEKWGARAELAVGPFPPVGVYAATTVSAGDGPNGFALFSVQAALGPDAFWQLTDAVKLSAGVGALLDWTRVGLWRSDLGSDEGATVRLGLESWLGVIVDWDSDWSLVGRGGVCLFSESPQVFVLGQNAARLPAVLWVSQLGLGHSF